MGPKCTYDHQMVYFSRSAALHPWTNVTFYSLRLILHTYESFNMPHTSKTYPNLKKSAAFPHASLSQRAILNFGYSNEAETSFISFITRLFLSLRYLSMKILSKKDFLVWKKRHDKGWHMHMAPWVHTKDILNPLSTTSMTNIAIFTGSYTGSDSEFGLVNRMKDCLSGEWMDARHDGKKTLLTENFVDLTKTTQFK